MEFKVADAGCGVNNGGRVCCSFSMYEGIDSSTTSFIDGIASCKVYFRLRVQWLVECATICGQQQYVDNGPSEIQKKCVTTIE